MSSNAITSLRKTESIDKAISDYRERSPSPRQNVVEDFVAEVLQSQDSLTETDVTKLIQLEDKVQKQNPEKAKKICDLCLKLLLQVQSHIVTGPEVSKVEVLLTKVKSYENQATIVTSIACLDPQDRSDAIQLLLDAIKEGKKIEDPFNVIFEGSDGDARKRRALSYLESELSSSDTARQFAIAELIILRNRELIGNQEHHLYKKAKEMFITPETLNQLLDHYESALNAERPPVKLTKDTLKNLIADYEKALKGKSDRGFEVLKTKLAAGDFAYYIAQLDQDNPDEAAKLLFDILQHILSQSDQVAPGKEFSPQNLLFFKLMKLFTEGRFDERGREMARKELSASIRAKGPNSTENQEIKAIRRSIEESHISSWMRQAGTENPEINAQKFFAILKHVLNQSDKIAPGERLSPRDKAFMKYIKLTMASLDIRSGTRAGITSVYNHLPDEDRHFVPSKPVNFG